MPLTASRIRRCGSAAVAVGLAATTLAISRDRAGAAPAAVTTHDGTLPDGASWTIDVPANWNGTLLLFSHGLVPPGGDNPEQLTLVRRRPSGAGPHHAHDR